jgi:hypothetical protein
LIREAIEHDDHGDDYDSVKKDVFSRLVLAGETDGKYAMSTTELVRDSTPYKPAIRPLHVNH